MAVTARDVLERNHRAANEFAISVGRDRARKLLEEAASELADRLERIEGRGSGPGSFSAVQARQTLAQIQLVTRALVGGMRDELMTMGGEIVPLSIDSLVSYMEAAEKEFAGLSAVGLDIRTAAMMDEVGQGVRSSILSRIAHGPDGTPGKMGILARYGTETVSQFERIMQKGIIAKTPWAEMREQLTAASPFLQGAPAHWAERILRTETMHAQNRAAMLGAQKMNEELEDMVKILSATFDDRTGSDSYAVHGQIRRLNEEFESWFGPYDHPPNRPNDREIVIYHRLAWPLPSFLAPMSDDEIEERWSEHEKRKGSPPPRPLMSTVSASEFGKDDESAEEAPPEEAKAEEAPPEEAPPEEAKAEEAPPEEAPPEEANLPEKTEEEIAEEGLSNAKQMPIDNNFRLREEGRPAYEEASYKALFREFKENCAPVERGAIEKFTKHFDWTIRAIQQGMGEQELLEKVIAHHGDNAPADSNGIRRVTAAEHIDIARKASDLIEHVFDTNKTTYEGTVYRGIGNLSDQVFGGIFASDTIEFNAATSTTIDPSVAESFAAKGGWKIIFRIAQSSGIPIEGISKYPDENEILMRKGASFAVTKRTRRDSNTFVIDLVEK